MFYMRFMFNLIYSGFIFGLSTAYSYDLKTPIEEGAHDVALVAPEFRDASEAPYNDQSRLWQGIPSVEITPDGKLWAAWYSGGWGEGPENFILLARSDDNGSTWTSPIVAVDSPSPVRQFDPCLWVDPNGKMWIFWAQSFWHNDGRVGVWAAQAEAIHDGMPEWSSPRRLADGIMMNKPIAVSSNRWLYPIHHSRTVRQIGHRPTEIADGFGFHYDPYHLSACVYVSVDGGTTVRFAGSSKRAIHEQMLIQLNDGRLWMLDRRYSSPTRIGESFSDDQGLTWNEGTRGEIIPHVTSRFYIRRLHSGNLLLVRHARPDGQDIRSHLTAFISDDDGKSWKGGLLLDDRERVSYPDGCQGPDGTIYIIYDYNRTGSTSEDRKILLARFREEDVLAGEFNSTGNKTRILVNQALGER
jgi:hypothetical protein